MRTAAVLVADSPRSQAVATAHEYLRVSVDKSGRERSQGDQHTENEAAREANGWLAGESYKDTGSASKHARKARKDYERLIADLRRGEVFAPGDVLILWESSRGSRRQSEWATLLDLLEDNGALVYVTSHGRLYDPANYRDRRSLDEDGTDSAYESGKTSVRARRTAAANAVAGKPHGRIPYGFERIYDDKTKAFIEQRPKAGEAEVVVQIVTDVARGVSLKAITADLNARGVPTVTGAPWRTTQVRLLALNVAYIGKRIHDAGRHGRRPSANAIITDGCWPPISNDPNLKPEDQEAANEQFRVAFGNAQRILTDPKRKHSRPGKVKHLLSLIAQCGECDEGTLAVTYRLRDDKRPAYACRVHNCTYIDQADLDKWVTAEVLEHLTDPEQWDRLTAGEADDTALIGARAEVAELNADLQDTYSRAARWPRPGGISPAALAAIEPAKLTAITTAEGRVNDLSTPPALRSLLDGPGDLTTRWETAPITARREVVKLVAEVKVFRSPSRGHRVPAEQRSAIRWT